MYQKLESNISAKRSKFRQYTLDKYGESISL